MPEFEEKDSQPNPEHSYTPSASPQKKGGRRRSGGFKSEVAPGNSKIGEIDPAEALKAEVKKSASTSPKIAETQKSDLSQCSGASEESCSLNTKKSKSSKPQPEKATLDSIKRVEERIARRRAESEKDRSERNGHDLKNRNSRTQEKEKKAAKGGIFAAFCRFFGSLFGSSPADSSTKDQQRSSQKRSPRSRNQRRGNGNRNNDSGKKQKNRRGGPKNQRKNASQNT